MGRHYLVPRPIESDRITRRTKKESIHRIGRPINSRGAFVPGFLGRGKAFFFMTEEVRKGKQ